MLVSVLLFVAGATAFFQLPELPAWPAAVAAVPVVLWAFAARRRRLAFFLIGGFWAWLAATPMLSDRLDPALEGEDLVVTGMISDLPQRFDRGTRFDFRIDRGVSRRDARLPSKVRLTWYSSEVDLRGGQHWRLKVRLKRPHGNANPGGFDYERWLFVNGIGAIGYVREAADNQRLAVPAGASWLDNWRQDLDETLDATLTGRAMAGVVKAVTIGARGDIAPSQWDVFRRTGTAHLVAISGLHIGLVAGLVYWLVLRGFAAFAPLAWSPPKFAAMAAVAVSTGYAAMAGFSIPTQRALIMVAVVMAGIWLQRNLVPLRVWAVAMLAVVVRDPAAVLASGFWLSFFAVALILYGVGCRRHDKGARGGLLRVHWVTALGLAPLLLLFFQTVSLIAPVANFIAVPVFTLLAVPVSLLGILLAPLWPAAGAFCLRASESLLSWLWWGLERLAALPQAQLSLNSPPAWSLPFALLGVLVLLMPKGLPGRWLGLTLMLPLVVVRAPVPAHGELWLTLLDVGQGLAAVARTREHILVFDAGARLSDRFDMGSAAVVPFLRSIDAGKVDLLVVSHGDNDHIGGAQAVLQSVPTRAVLSSVPERLSAARKQTCRAGQTWTWDGVGFIMLSPPIGRLTGENDRSCVLRIESLGGSVLLTGDIERAAETWLTERYGAALASDVIVVPHHGSATSSTAAFLRAVRPRYALIPAGYRNRFRFPHADVVARYHRFGARVINTATAGAVRLELGPGRAIRCRAFRREEPHLWQFRPLVPVEDCS